MGVIFLGGEWIELFNPTNVSIDASHFELKTSKLDVVGISPINSIILPGRTMMINLGKEILYNGGDSITLIRPDGNIIDMTLTL